MDKYDYYDSVLNDVLTYIEDAEISHDDDIDKISTDLYEQMWQSDNVTGNCSGSYTFNSYEAEENLCHNLDLVYEVYECFGYDGIPFNTEAEKIDVSIRCYLLSKIMSDEAVINAINKRIEELKEEKFE